MDEQQAKEMRELIEKVKALTDDTDEETYEKLGKEIWDYLERYDKSQNNGK